MLDVVVIGGGAMGASSAWHLARRGRSVALVEQFEPLHDRGSSHGATRIFRVAYRDPDYVRLAADAVPWWRELEAESGTVLLEQTGQLDHGDPAAIGQIAANLRAGGFVAEEVTPEDAARRWPHMRFDRAVVRSPDGGRVFADRTVAALQRLAATRGASLSFDERVVAVEPAADGVTVRTDRRQLVAATVVVAAGSWINELVAPGTAGLPPFTTSVEVPVHFRPRRPEWRWPSFLHHGDAAAGPLAFAAYGLETPGLGVKVGCDRASSPDQVADYVREWHPGLDPEPISWTECRFTNTPDERFVIDRVGPVVICSPCSGHGFKFTPIVGEVVADLCDGVRPSHDFGVRGSGV